MNCLFMQCVRGQEKWEKGETVFFISSPNIYLFSLPFPKSYEHVLLALFHSLAFWVFN